MMDLNHTLELESRSQVFKRKNFSFLFACQVINQGYDLFYSLLPMIYNHLTRFFVHDAKQSVEQASKRASK